MTPRDLIYWIQGGYEYGGPLTGTLTEAQARTLKNHIEMCKATSGKFNPDLLAFRTWMEAALELGSTHEQIQAKLNQLFVHVIDPMTTDLREAAAQTAAHQGHWSRLEDIGGQHGGAIMKC